MLTEVGEDNKHKYGVATQDIELRKALRKIPGTPLVYISSGVLILEPPSTETKLKTNEIEHKKVVSGIPKLKPSEDGADRETEKPKRKKPQAPNPLSIKKKKPIIQKAFQVIKKKAEASGESIEKVVEAGGGAVKKSDQVIAVPQNEKGEAKGGRKRNRRKKPSHMKKEADEQE
ncbi:hypothetical protein HDU97_000083 [Phlyctochytrium planicorne]|nr:hypothetical protein HDU97_000083 [Phlyctochytrium planicorne]